jgi:predicted DNA binding protein
LADAFDRVRALEFRLDGTIGPGPPLVWVAGPDRRTVRRALETDPSVTVVAGLDGEPPFGDRTLDEGTDDCWLYRLEFGARSKLFAQIVADGGGAVLEASGRNDRWSVQLLFHSRVAVSECHAAFDRYGFHTEVTRISGSAALGGTQTSLTDVQHETIHAAYELGYFHVPRQITLEELAAELDVFHQALSERLRRSHAALATAQLSGESPPPTAGR